jgi:hypothetical protein
MSLLYKTISSFFPNKAMCAFVEEPWFIENHELQLDVLQLCQAGYACMLFSKISDHETFKMQMKYFINRYVDTADNVNHRNHYSKYCLPYRRVNIYLIEVNGCSGMIDCIRDDFDEHLENIMQFILMCYRLHGENARTMLVSGLCDEIKANFKLNNNAAANVDAEVS